MSEQKDSITLPLARIRWLQEMGVAPAMLRPYAPATLRPSRGGTISSEAAQDASLKAADDAAQGVLGQPEGAAPTPKQAGKGRESFLAMLQSLDKGQSSPAPEARRTVAMPPSKEQEPSKQSVQPIDDAAHSTVEFSQWQQQVQNCTACARSQTRASVLLGVGARTQPEWFVLAGAPTRQDEAAGKAWQSSAGRLLEAQLRSIGLDPDTQVYRSYALKCRSDHSTASADSIAACQQVFFQELSWVQPKRLLVLGQEAVQMVFGPQANLAQLRGQLQQWQSKDGHSLPVVVSADPASLLLRPQQKAQAWQDLLLMRQLMHAGSE